MTYCNAFLVNNPSIAIVTLEEAAEMTFESDDKQPAPPRPTLTHQHTVSEENDQSMDEDEEEASKFVDSIPTYSFNVRLDLTGL